jgi:hypothetical protein
MPKGALANDQTAARADRDPPDALVKPFVRLLLQVASVARAFAGGDLDARTFHAMVAFAVDQSIVSAEALAEMGRVDRTTASRWINGRNTPNALTQEAVLRRIADLAEQRARQLKRAGGGEAGL